MYKTSPFIDYALIDNNYLSICHTLKLHPFNCHTLLYNATPLPLQTLVINNEDLSFVATIGEGHFGIVDKMVCKGTSMAVKVHTHTSHYTHTLYTHHTIHTHYTHTHTAAVCIVTVEMFVVDLFSFISRC